jgi:hypothetical protein
MRSGFQMQKWIGFMRLRQLGGKVFISMQEAEVLIG